MTPPPPPPPPGPLPPIGAAEPPKRRRTGCIVAAVAVGALALLCLCVAVVWVLPRVRDGGASLTDLVGPTRVSTRTVGATPTSMANIRGGTIFADDFSSNAHGWEEGVIDEVGIRRAVEGGAYRIGIDSDMRVAWSTAGNEFDVDDFVLEVDATPVAGPDDNGYGVIFRYVDRENFYYFEISSDGYYQFRSNYEDEWVNLIDWIETDAINLGKQLNHITVMARGNQFEFQINGQTVATFEDDSFASGTFGVAVSTGEQGGVHVAFDNLEVRELR